MKQVSQVGTIFNIQKFSVHDGPGIRTTVFMKGCPLQCRWCSNAESMNPEPELGFIRSSCNNCGNCIEVCFEKAISFDSNGFVQFERNLCTACGECVSVCSPGALVIYGRQVTVDDVFKEICKDKIFYEGSSGGVTVSGGEPLRQADFVAALFQKCHQAGIKTCLDTSGYSGHDKLREVLAFTNYVLYDIKHMDSDSHKHFTGVPNDRILSNAAVVAESGINILFRIPLIKNVNDTENNIRETARFIKTLSKHIAVELLPYHRLGIGKYQTLGRVYLQEAITAPSPEKIEAVICAFEEQGIKCTAGS
ncbi:glycyl-radical enzyme activating protein [Chloroflexota bacterium]